MREEAGTPTAASAAELAQGLALLGESQALLRQIMAGLVLQYHSLDVERCKLLAGPASTPGPQPKDMQAGASLLTLNALFGFQRQAQMLADQAAQAGGCPDRMDINLGAISILITLLRLFRLCGPQPAQASAPLETAEELAEPVI